MNDSIAYEKCIVFGTGQFAFQCADLLRHLGRLDGVYEYGAFQQSGLEELCSRANYPYQRFRMKREADCFMEALCSDNQRTLILSASNIYIFPGFVCNHSGIDIINYHPALLASHLGRNTEAWAIFEQDEETGVTWHEVITEVDRGKVYIQETIKLDSGVTSLKLMLLQYRLGLHLLKRILPSVLAGEVCEKSAPGKAGVMHYAAERPNQGYLDLRWGGEKISAFLRSMDYGKLHVLGRPFLRDEGKVYTWQRYAIIKSGEPYSRSDADRLVIKDDVCFLLCNFYEIKEETI